MNRWKEITFLNVNTGKILSRSNMRSHEFTLECAVLHVMCGKYALEISQDCIATLKMNISM
jgi:hypothetical protein